MLSSIFNQTIEVSDDNTLGKELAKSGLEMFQTDYVMVLLGDVSHGNDELPEGIIWFFLANKEDIICKKEYLNVTYLI